MRLHRPRSVHGHPSMTFVSHAIMVALGTPYDAPSSISISKGVSDGVVPWIEVGGRFRFVVHTSLDRSLTCMMRRQPTCLKLKERREVKSELLL